MLGFSLTRFYDKYSKFYRKSYAAVREQHTYPFKYGHDQAGRLHLSF